MCGWKSDFGGLIPIFRNNIFQKVDYFVFSPLYFSYTIGLCSIPLLRTLVEQGLFSLSFFSYVIFFCRCIIFVIFC